MNIAEGLTGLTFNVELDDGEVIADAVIIARITRLDDGRNTVGFAKSDGADAVTVAGLLDCAREINRSGWHNVDDD